MSLPVEDLDHCSLGPPKSTSQTVPRSFQPFLQVLWSLQTDQLTDRLTDYSVCSNRPHLPSAIWPKNCPTEQNLPNEKYMNSMDCCNVVYAHRIIVYAGQRLLKFYLLTLHDVSRTRTLLLNPSEHRYATGCSMTPVVSACSLF